MILSSVTATLGKEGTVVLVLLLWATLLIVFFVLKKRIHSSQSLLSPLTNISQYPKTFETRFLENTFFLYFFLIFLSVSLFLGIITLYLQEPLISLLALLFLSCSLMIFGVYLAIVLLFIYKTWWSS